MVKKIITASTIVFTLIAFEPVSAQKFQQNNLGINKQDVKFLNDIEVSFDKSMMAADNLSKVEKPLVVESEIHPNAGLLIADYNTTIENVNSVQLKYGVLLNTEIELIKNFSLYRAIDEWYGTPYRFGGYTKKGIDCSAFVKAVYATIFGILLPRTAREQFAATRQIFRNELKEGDLVFFNTLGGVSHVGIYLQNNKFVHAAAAEGVSISDLDDSYWSRRFIGATRYDMAAFPGSVASLPQP